MKISFSNLHNSDSMIHYVLSYQHPHQQFIDITLTLADIHQPVTYLQLPSWRPGRYELGNFAKNIQRFQIEDAEGRPLPCTKITKDRWKVPTEGISQIIVRYNYYAATLDAGSSWLDTDQLYVNFVNCLLYVEGRTAHTHQVHLQIPDHYQVACGLPRVAFNVLEAPSYYHLAESPMVASAQLTHWTYTVADHTFHIWIQGVCRLQRDETIRHFQTFTEAQIEMMGNFPCPDYHFIFQFLPYRAYHGVEHFNSTVITLGPAEQLLEGSSLYDDLLGISSHELFHTWNIIRIRPAEMMPYDYTRENYFPTGFIAEGVTTYYGDLFLVRSGVITLQEYFRELNKLFKRHFDNFGRFNHSLTESSYDLWLDGYGAGIPNRKVSIYVKGALVSLILDLSLRNATGHQQSLDTFMRCLWERFGRPAQGYTLQNLQDLVMELSRHQLTTYFDDFVYGKLPLEEALAALLPTVGCRLQVMDSAFISEREFGFRTNCHDGRTVVSAIEPGSPAAAHLRLSDEIVAVNQRRVADSVDELLVTRDAVTLTIFRQHYLHTFRIASDGRKFFKQYTIVQQEDASATAQESFAQWLHLPR